MKKSENTKERKNRYAKKKDRKNKKVWKKVLLVIIIILLIGIGWFTYRTIRNGGGLGRMLATVVGHDENTKKKLKEIVEVFRTGYRLKDKIVRHSLVKVAN